MPTTPTEMTCRPVCNRNRNRVNTSSDKQLDMFNRFQELDERQTAIRFVELINSTIRALGIYSNRSIFNLMASELDCSPRQLYDSIMYRVATDDAGTYRLRHPEGRKVSLSGRVANDIGEF